MLASSGRRAEVDASKRERETRKKVLWIVRSKTKFYVVKKRKQISLNFCTKNLYSDRYEDEATGFES
jgi:hypothetical protein